ncbi:MAG: hypothetical protein KBC50_01015 [Candidatus Pacebacteria bacterium]|jgi:hypothetical protein|nr:hypothetical protein [Candidatus Paceibacterota bacterium]
MKHSWLSVVAARLFTALLPRPVSGRGIAYDSGYAAFYYACQSVVVDWHKSELKRLDVDYATQQASFDLVRARAEALKNGIGPSDPRYPDLWDHLNLGTLGNREPPDDTWLSKLLPRKK